MDNKENNSMNLQHLISENNSPTEIQRKLSKSRVWRRYKRHLRNVCRLKAMNIKSEVNMKKGWRKRNKGTKEKDIYFFPPRFAYLNNNRKGEGKNGIRSGKVNVSWKNFNAFFFLLFRMERTVCFYIMQ